MAGEGPVTTGLLFLPMTGLFAGLSLQAVRIQRRFGARTSAMAGLAVAAAGNAILLIAAAVRPGGGRGELLLPLSGLFVVGLGLGVSWSHVTTIGLRAVPAADAGQAAGILFTARWVGGAVGIAALGLVYRAAAAADLHGRLATLGITGSRAYDQLDGLLSGLAPARAGQGAVPAQAQPALAATVRGAASVGTAWALAGVTAAAALGSLLCVLFERDPVPAQARPPARQATRG